MNKEDKASLDAQLACIMVVVCFIAIISVIALVWLIVITHQLNDIMKVLK